MSTSPEAQIEEFVSHTRSVTRLVLDKLSTEDRAQLLSRLDKANAGAAPGSPGGCLVVVTELSGAQWKLRIHVAGDKAVQLAAIEGVLALTPYPTPTPT